MTILPSPSAPFGFLEPIHRYLVDSAQPLSAENASGLNYGPAICALQCLLLQYSHTRLPRIAVGLAGVVVMVNTWTSIRFVGMSAVCVIFKAADMLMPTRTMVRRVE